MWSSSQITRFHREQGLPVDYNTMTIYTSRCGDLESLGVAEANPSVSRFFLVVMVAGDVCQSELCLQFRKVPEANEGLRTVCAKVDLCKQTPSCIQNLW